MLGVLRQRAAVVATLACLLVLNVAAGAANAAAVDASALAAQVERFLTATYAADAPGAAVIVVRDGQVLYRGAHGLANLEHGIALAPDMVFRLGSITKQFTAAAILLLAEDGKLSLDDPITKHLPDYPVHGHTITVAHLLAHTSGIRSYTGIPGWMDKKIKEDLTVAELIDGFKHEPMDFAPGERFLYNNSGYVLLGAIIEEASGETYEAFLKKRIFEPLGMRSTYYGSHTQLIAKRAAGYDGADGDYANAQYLSMMQPYAAGALLSTVDDLARWDAALYTDKLLSVASRQRLMTPFQLNSGEPLSYAGGLIVGELRDRPMISHGGGIFGFRTHALRLPEERLFVAVLSNSTGHPAAPGYVAQKIAALAIGDPFPDRVPIELPLDVLERYTGVYRIDDDTTRQVTLVDGRLYTQRSDGPKLPILPQSTSDFFYERSFTHLRFVADRDGQVSHMLVYQDGSKTPERADLTDEPLPESPAVATVDPSVYDDYVGRYQLRPGFVLAITHEGGRLLGQATGQAQVELLPEGDDRFFLKLVEAKITFVRGADGAVGELILHQGGQEITAKRID